MCAHHECVAHGVRAAKQESLRLLVQTARGRHCLIAIGLWIHQTVIDGHVVRKEFELLWVLRKVVDLAAEQLRRS